MDAVERFGLCGGRVEEKWGDGRRGARKPAEVKGDVRRRCKGRIMMEGEVDAGAPSLPGDSWSSSSRG